MKKKLFVLLVSMFTLTAFNNSNAQDGMIGEVRMFAGNFAPRGWALCHGQILPIETHTALFSVLGTNYGGDGRTTFGLPDLRGRVAIGTGDGPGLSSATLGEKKGTETTTLIQSNLPGHTHTVAVPELWKNGMQEVMIPINMEGSIEGGIQLPANNPANEAPTTTIVQSEITGESAPVNNMQPSLTINYIICTDGTYPVRN